MFRSVTLEMSLKPFKQTDDAYIEAVIRKVFAQWQALLKNRKTISIMMWASDGSEILDYAGDLDAPFEWARFVGTANRPLLDVDETPDTSLHIKKQHYIPDAPVMTYRVLKKIVETIKRVGKEFYPDSVIRVGETFDIGPEFAVSDFKYRRHREITSGTKLDSFGFVDATALLNADNHSYAAYPNGIPQDTPFAEFLGKQTQVFFEDMGFDYLWLSNGLGFSSEPWDMTGKIFDGGTFHPKKLLNTRQQVFQFWKLFRQVCPDIPLETRGTNNSVGIDYATDGVPLYDIYNAGLNIAPPPNSPWAALTDDFGLEIMGHMTRICELPGDSFLFRYYVHDIWWVNSPWYDRYGGQPHDIYMPMAVTRIDKNGKICSADCLNILSIDNSYGNMPDTCANEPIPHLLKAEKDCADGIAPLVWVYPMREYTTATTEIALREMYYGDQYIRQAINNGLPLNCVVSTDNFLKTPLNLYNASVLLSPVPQSDDVAERLREFEASGGRVIYYGGPNAAGELAYRENYVDHYTEPTELLRKLENYGISIRFKFKAPGAKPNAMTVSSVDNGLMFSVYNPNLTTDTMLRFPLGAPILTGMDTELIDGYAVYRFGKSEHRECRVFVEQQSGVITVKELAPVSTVYHRKLALNGLKDATVCIFPESRKKHTLFVDRIAENMDLKPCYDPRFQKVEDEKYGIYYRAEHITGNYTILLPH